MKLHEDRLPGARKLAVWARKDSDNSVRKYREICAAHEQTYDCAASVLSGGELETLLGSYAPYDRDTCMPLPIRYPEVEQ